jgi:hypothetical protein
MRKNNACVFSNMDMGMGWMEKIIGLDLFVWFENKVRTLFSLEWFGSGMEL